MKYLLAILLLAAASLHAQDVTATVVSTSGESPLPSPYIFSTTPEGASTTSTVRLRNNSSNRIMIATVSPVTSQSTSAASPDFTVTGLALDKILTAGDTTSFEDFTLTFAPTETGLLTAYLQVIYQTDNGSCSFTSTTPSTQCPSQTALLSILQGDATASQLVLSYAAGSGQTTLQPNSTSPLDFGNVSTSATKTITFTLTNQASGTLTTPAVTLQTAAYNTTAFSLDTSALATSIAASGTTNFAVTFAPGQAAQSQATLQVGNNTYLLTGTGIVAGGLDALVITYVDSTGVRLTAQGSSAINFGSLIVGASSGNTLTFTVTNPSSSFDALTIPAITVTGSGFALSAPVAAPVSISPGQSTSFGVIYSANAAGTSNGTLTIGTRQFSLTGTASQPSLNLSLSVDESPLTSQQQAHVTVHSSTAAGSAAIGQLTMTFTPAVSGVSDDPAIEFTATSSRQLQVTLAQGTQAATYNGSSNITFQTGTTAGTLTFTLTFPNEPTLTKSFTITPTTVQISSGTAVRQSPNLVVTLSGYDNSYSVGNLAFTFFDTTGKQINASPISVDASSEFHTYFLTQSTVGGAFSVQASFPVTGDVMQIGSVQVVIGNNSGSSTVSENFQ